jgi:hypothetical protein
MGTLERFSVCHPDEGLVSTHATRLEAMQKAVAWEARSGYSPCYRMEVFDAMAKQTAPNLWRLRPGGHWEATRIAKVESHE